MTILITSEDKIILIEDFYRLFAFRINGDLAARRHESRGGSAHPLYLDVLSAQTGAEFGIRNLGKQLRQHLLEGALGTEVFALDHFFPRMVSISDRKVSMSLNSL